MHKSVPVYWTLSKAQIAALQVGSLTQTSAFYYDHIYKNAFLFSLCALHIKREERKIGTMYCDTLALNKQKEESRKSSVFLPFKTF
jgi:hypothetical protein